MLLYAVNLYNLRTRTACLSLRILEMLFIRSHPYRKAGFLKNKTFAYGCHIRN
jgi:hypothetical protein